MEDYVKASLYVEKNIWENFKNYVLNKYGKLRGVLGRELSNALAMFLQQETLCAHTQNDQVIDKCKSEDNKKAPPKAREKLRNLSLITEKLIEFTNGSDGKIHQQALEKIIVETTFCMDKRTIKNYINSLLTVYRVIRIVGGTRLPMYKSIDEKAEELFWTVDDATKKRRRPYLIFEVVKPNAEKLARLYKEGEI